MARVRLSTPDRVYFPESGITKSEIAQYYERMADRVLPGLVDRPLSLVRCPEGREGECFYQQRAWRSIPASVPRVVVKKGRAAYAMEVKQFAAGAAGQLVRAAPDRFAANMSKARCPGKIFLDVLRNAPEATAIASWSTRARPGAPVAATLAWDELGPDEAPRVTLRDAPSRLERPDPWASFDRSRRRLTESTRRRVGAL